MTNTMAVMAPLYLAGNPQGPESERRAWKQFEEQLAAAKRLGATAVSTDVWWGMVETSERMYDWSYYDRVSDLIIKAGLKWVAITSLHQCGGNIGDTVNVPLPSWVWTKVSHRGGFTDVNAVKYVSEQGNASSEYVSCWATPLVLDDYTAFFAAFQSHFAAKAEHIAEINISLGPAGELRFPSYNSHDQGTDYPSRGALQCYSELAQESFHGFVMNRYGTDDGIRAAWGYFENIEAPRDVDAFFAHGVHANTQYGRDFYDWYSGSLLAHGQMVMDAAKEIFSVPDAPFAGIDLGAKVPGVHWRMGHCEGDRLVLSDRYAELNAGLIRSSDLGTRMDESHGYSHIIRLFRDLQSPRARVVLHFTCLEMADGENESLAYQLVRWVGAEAMRQGVPLKGENALNFTLANPESWDRLRSALSLYEGLTILRISDVVEGEVARREFEVTARTLARTASVVARVKSTVAAATSASSDIVDQIGAQLNPLLVVFQAARRVAVAV